MASRSTRRVFFKSLTSIVMAPGLAGGVTPVAAQTPEQALDDLAEGLRTSGGGRILRAGDPDYRKMTYYNARFDCVRTRAYLQPSTTRGVVKILEWARQHKRSLAVRGTGHSFEGRSSHPDIVVDMSRMTKLDLKSDGTLVVEAGVQLGDIYKTLGPAGRILPAGTCPTVGIVGHALGGGIGDFLPMFGYAAQSLIAVTLVTFRGTVLHVDDNVIGIEGDVTPLPSAYGKSQDVMTALRGGGQGSLGIVTSMTFKTHNTAGMKLASFNLKTASEVNAARAVAILEAWQNWREQLPPEMHSMVSSKLNLGRSDNGFSFEIAGLIAVPPQTGKSVADVRRTLELLFKIPELRGRQFSENIDTVVAIKSFLDDNETTHNPSRKMLYGSSSVLPSKLSRDALEFLTTKLQPHIFVSLYTSGGATKSGLRTSLHPSEFLIEWSIYSPKRDASAHSQIKAIAGELIRKSGFPDIAFPNYPDSERRDYFTNRAAIDAMRAVYDPDGLSTSSLLVSAVTSSGAGGCI
jgi:hypothetical protein